MKKYILYSLLVTIVSITSCENRSDIFKNTNTAPIVLLADNEWMDKANDTLKVSMRYGESCTLYYEYNDNYQVKDSLLFAIITHEGKPNCLQARRVAKTNKIVIDNLLPKTTLTDTITKTTIHIALEDYYHLQGSAWIEVSVKANQPPTPVFTIQKRDSMECKITTDKSTDVDGDKVVAYEYVIGSQLADELVYNEIGYETEDFNPYMPNANAGRAAKGGTYHVSTPITNIQHVFQQPGIYSVSVRCKDAIGLWSKWSTTLVEW